MSPVPATQEEQRRWFAAVEDAHGRVRTALERTALREAPGLAGPGTSALLKLESHQPTGSFKVRGAFSKLLALTGDERARGVIAASTGNHGAAVAFASRQIGIAARVIVPSTTPEDRVRAIARFGAEVLLHGAECGEAEARARVVAAETGAVFVSPYNDPLVMAGQGTLGLELAGQAPDLEAVYVAAGGGGLIGGIAAALSECLPECEVIGVSPLASRALDAAVKAGRVVDVPHEPTLSLATAGAMEEDSVTLAPCMALVDRWVCMDEDAIAEGMRVLHANERLVAEGAAGLATAGWLADHRAGRAKERSAIVVCGGNLDRADLVRVFGANR